MGLRSSGSSEAEPGIETQRAGSRVGVGSAVPERVNQRQCSLCKHTKIGSRETGEAGFKKQQSEIWVGVSRVRGDG